VVRRQIDAIARGGQARIIRLVAMVRRTVEIALPDGDARRTIVCPRGSIVGQPGTTTTLACTPLCGHGRLHCGLSGRLEPRLLIGEASDQRREFPMPPGGRCRPKPHQLGLSIALGSATGSVYPVGESSHH
jgi:hypothetical protein